MAKSKKSSEFSEKGFGRAYDQAGTSSEVEDFLKEQGLLEDDQPSGRSRRSSKKSTARKKTTKRSSAKKKTATRSRKKKTKTKAPTLRRRGRRAFKGRHFRLPLETDDQLQFLVRHYDCYMLDVIKLAIHNEWLRVTRELRKQRRSRKGSSEDGDAEGAENAS